MRRRGGVTTEYRVAGPNQSYTRVEVDPSDRKDNGGMYCPTVADAEGFGEGREELRQGNGERRDEVKRLSLRLSIRVRQPPSIVRPSVSDQKDAKDSRELDLCVPMPE